VRNLTLIAQTCSLINKSSGIRTSVANREIAYDGNMEALRRYFFRPRMLRDMSNGSTKTSFLGITSELPIYIAPAAMAKLGHPLGEVNLTKAAGDYGIVQAVSCLVKF
jgi:L-lactate dehydrogenase (cytochrome)